MLAPTLPIGAVLLLAGWPGSQEAADSPSHEIQLATVESFEPLEQAAYAEVREHFLRKNLRPPSLPAVLYRQFGFWVDVEAVRHAGPAPAEEHASLRANRVQLALGSEPLMEVDLQANPFFEARKHASDNESVFAAAVSDAPFGIPAQTHQRLVAFRHGDVVGVLSVVFGIRDFTPARVWAAEHPDLAGGAYTGDGDRPYEGFVAIRYRDSRDGFQASTLYLPGDDDSIVFHVYPSDEPDEFGLPADWTVNIHVVLAGGLAAGPAEKVDLAAAAPIAEPVVRELHLQISSPPARGR